MPQNTASALTDPQAENLERAASIEISSQLMEDIVAGDVLSVQPGKNKVALFSNPSSEGTQPEALVIDEGGRLTYLSRSSSGAGWQQVPITDYSGTSFMASEVVTLVHHYDLSVWAIFADSLSQKLRTLRLENSGGQPGHWLEVGGINYALNPVALGVHDLFVSYYDCRAYVFGLNAGNNQIVRVAASIMSIPKYYFFGLVHPIAHVPGVTDIVGGYGPSKNAVYILRDGVVLQYEFGLDGKPVNPATVATGVSRLCGVYPTIYNKPGCLYLSGADLVAFNKTGNSFEEYRPYPGLGFVEAKVRTDASGMLHLYGVDKAGALKVLHQAAWAPGNSSKPVWSSAKDQGGTEITACIAFLPDVLGFHLDLSPVSQPAQFVQHGGSAPSAERFSICRQDVTSTRWARETIRLRSTGKPYRVTRYVVDAAVNDGRGMALPDLPVTLSANAPVEVRSGNRTLILGPDHHEQIRTDAFGRLSLSLSATGLVMPTLRLNAAGLAQGAVVQPASGVQNFLSGTSPIGSQPGLFTDEALAGATVGGKKIVDPTKAEGVKAAVNATQHVFALAHGNELRSRLHDRRRIHGFAASAPGQGFETYREFADAKEASDHLAAIRALPNYGGIWADFQEASAEFWEGVRNGVIDIVHVVVQEATALFFKIGETIIEIKDLLIDSLAAAGRVAESCLRLVVDDVQKVVDWLKALFAFEAIWNTKTALESATRTITGYAASTIAHHGIPAGWFEQQRVLIDKQLDRLKAEYAGRRVGDIGNHQPSLSDTQGFDLPPGEVAYNPQGNWLLNQTMSQAAAAAAAGQGLIEAQPEGPVAAVAEAFEQFLADLLATDLGPEIERLKADIDVLFATVARTNDPEAAEGAAMTALLDLPGPLIGILLKVADKVAQALVRLCGTVYQNLQVVLDTPISFGPLNSLYEWIQTQLPKPPSAPETLTLGRLGCLLVSFSATPAYRLVVGLDREPFPNGAFPALPAPPWFQGGAAEEGFDLDSFLLDLQIFLGLSQIAAGVCSAITDVSPALAADKALSAAVNTNIGMASFYFSNVCGLIGSYPLVTGSRLDSPFMSGFYIAAVSTALAGGVLCYQLTGKGGSALLKNVGDTGAGPLIASALGLGSTIATGKACGEEGTDLYSAAMYILPSFAAAFQFVRTKVVPSGPADPAASAKMARASFVGGLDLITNTAAGVMMVYGATRPPPVIPEQTPPAGKVAQGYSYRIVAEPGSDLAFSPIKDWRCDDGSTLPPGLAIDDKTGLLSGTPTQAGTFDFSVSCSDSYGPPHRSAGRSLAVVVHG